MARWAWTTAMAAGIGLACASDTKVERREPMVVKVPARALAPCNEGPQLKALSRPEEWVNPYDRRRDPQPASLVVAQVDALDDGSAAVADPSDLAQSVPVSGLDAGFGGAGQMTIGQDAGTSTSPSVETPQLDVPQGFGVVDGGTPDIPR